MATSQSKSKPSWAGVKAKLADFDRLGLLALVHDLYSANKENQMFLHARFNLGEGTLEPYKQTIARWLWPDVLRNQDTSVARAKQAVSNYSNAVREPAGLAELMVFFCEQAAGFSYDIGYSEENYFNALVRMFEQALKVIQKLPKDDRRDALVARLDRVRQIALHFGYVVGDDIDSCFTKYTKGI